METKESERTPTCFFCLFVFHVSEIRGVVSRVREEVKNEELHTTSLHSSLSRA